MPLTSRGPTDIGPGDVPPEVLRGARGRNARRIVRWLIWVGLALVASGFVVAVLDPGPSVVATVVLSAGLLMEAAGLVAYRILFWASVYAKDRPKTANRVRKSGP